MTKQTKSTKKELLQAELEGMQLRKECYERDIQKTEADLDKLILESSISQKQREDIRNKIEEILVILSMDSNKETLKLYRERELENLKVALNNINKKIETMRKRVKLADY
jgi:hypothetical protein